MITALFPIDKATTRRIMPKNGENRQFSVLHFHLMPLFLMTTLNFLEDKLAKRVITLSIS